MIGAARGLLAAGALAGAGCGDDACSSLSGSAGQGMSLAFDGVSIQHIPGANHAVVVRYAKGGELPAIFSVDLGATAPRAGLEVQWTADTGNVSRAARDGQDFGAAAGGALELSAWGGGRAEGVVGARFDGGRSLRGEFCGPVEEVAP